jgi:hypothetical protein
LIATAAAPSSSSSSSKDNLVVLNERGHVCIAVCFATLLDHFCIDGEFTCMLTVFGHELLKSNTFLINSFEAARILSTFSGAVCQSKARGRVSGCRFKW